MQCTVSEPMHASHQFSFFIIITQRHTNCSTGNLTDRNSVLIPSTNYFIVCWEEMWDWLTRKCALNRGHSSPQMISVRPSRKLRGKTRSWADDCQRDHHHQGGRLMMQLKKNEQLSWTCVGQGKGRARQSERKWLRLRERESCRPAGRPLWTAGFLPSSAREEEEALPLCQRVRSMRWDGRPGWPCTNAISGYSAVKLPFQNSNGLLSRENIRRRER